ncbi:MAG: rhodanese-like domain-containing protein [Gammaproteobacteria bacterium]
MDRLVEYAANHPFLAGGLVAVTVLVIGYEIRQRLRGGRDMGPLEAVGLINNDAAVVDVRAPAQFDKGHVLNARNIPLSDFESAGGTLENLKGRPVVVYCDNGMASGRAVQMLRARGIEDVVNLRGGLNAWKAENLPVVRGKGRKKGSS